MPHTHEEMIDKTIQFVQDQVQYYDGGHDWQHAYRVWQMSKYIAKAEQNADLLVVELAALLHDVGDYKFHDGDENICQQKIESLFKEFALPDEISSCVIGIIRNISFSSQDENGVRSRELEIVQDADRLDAIGAIGIARAFNFGGYKGNPIYDLSIKARKNMTKAEYRKNESPTINHFYEKLLLLKDQMNTSTGRRLAESRHEFMKNFLDQFFSEWNVVSSIDQRPNSED